jgi:glycogen operon protein
LRARQARNAAALLLLSRGALLWRSGDEVLLSHDGNNNPWCQDGPAWWIDHDSTPMQLHFRRFVQGLLGLRRSHAVLHGDEWFRVSGPGSVRWHGADLSTPDWDHGGLRLTMHMPAEQGPSFLLLVNGEPEEAVLQLPPCASGAWHRIVDTAAEPPRDFTPLAEAEPVRGPCTLTGRSLVLLASR